MKKLILPFLFFCFSNLAAQQITEPHSLAIPHEVSSPDAILKTLYEVISGPIGELRDWDRMKSLFLPEARLIPTFTTQTEEQDYRFWTVQDYIDIAGKSLEENGFFETEIHRVTEEYGNIMQVFSTYESRRKAEDAEPFARGINSIQLMYDGERWWIVNIFWMGETPAQPIPEQYLPK